MLDAAQRTPDSTFDGNSTREGLQGYSDQTTPAPEGISLKAHGATAAFPTDSKERERDQRNRREELGLEAEVEK